MHRDLEGGSHEHHRSRRRRGRRRQRREARHEARDRRHPRLGRRPREGVLRGSRVEAGRRLRGRRLPDRPAHPAGLRVLDPVRHRAHLGRARLGRRASSSSPTSRPRTTSSPTTASTPAVFHDTSVGYNRFDPAHPGERSRPGAAHLRVVRGVPRSRTATCGSCRRSRTGCPGRVDPATTTFSSVGGSRAARSSGPRPRTASTSSAPASAT